MSKDKETIENNMILVEAGRFEMGKESEAKLLIRITNDYFISKFPVTFAEYDEYCNDAGKRKRKKKPSDEYWGRRNRPVINVTWYDAIEYCNWMSRKENGLEEVYAINKRVKDINNENEARWDNKKWIVTCDFDKNGYRLPTEAEWEFAARGGNGSKGFKYSGSNEINEVTWYVDNSGDKTHPVGEKKSNELGIYDMNGNVNEWCWDWYSDKSTSNYYDPKGSKTGLERVRRGGDYSNLAVNCRVTSGYFDTPSLSHFCIGFRVSRTC